MPIETQPNVIEQSDFTAGVFLDVEESGIPKNGLSESLNNLIDVATGSIRSRKGFSRYFDNTANEGYRIYSLHPYTTPGGVRYLVAVLSTNLDAGSDNVMVYSLRLSNSAWTKISPSRNWNSANGRHWGGVVDGTYYGGGEEDEMYSWRPGETDTGAWSAATAYIIGDQATVATIEYRCVRAHTNQTPATDANRPKYWVRCFRLTPGVPSFWTYAGTERPADYAFKNEQPVYHTWTKDGDAKTGSFIFDYEDDNKRSNGIRYPKWEGTRQWNLGQHVSVRTTEVSTDNRKDVWKTFKCIKKHGWDDDATKDFEPNVTLTWRTYWTKVKADPPVDSSGRVNLKQWRQVPDCPKSRVGLFHGNRLFLRNDPTQSQTLVYSAQLKMAEKEVGFGVDEDNSANDRLGEAGNPQWDSADWRVRGAVGGGFQPFETAEGDPIQALGSLGYYLVIFKQYSTWVIAGFNPETWTIRQLAPVGAIYAAAVCEHEGLLYFISDAGFFQTDGTQVVPVPGAEKIEGWLRRHVDWAGQPNDITMFSHDGFVWISVPADGQIAEESGASERDPTLVLCYDAVTQSFWPQSISMQAVAKQIKGGSAKLFFSGPNTTATDLTAKQYDWGTWSAGSWATDNSGTREAKRKRKSRRSAAGIAPFDYNLFENPSFESDTKWGAPSEWVKTTLDGAGSFNYGLVVNSTKAASRRGRRAAHISNRRAYGWAGGFFNGAEGIKQTITIGSVAACVMQVDYRRANWKDDPERVPSMKFLKNETAHAPTGSKSLGNGWFRFYYNFTSVATALDYGFLVPEASDAHLDCAILTFNAGGVLRYFDGAGGEGNKYSGITGGNRPLIMQYGTGYTDDEGVKEQGSGDIRTRFINTVLRTGWFSFGVLKEERRIRRTWALVRGNTAETFIRTFINYRQRGDVSNIVTTTSDVRGSVHVENYVPDDAYSAQVHVEIEADRETAILGVALDTEPRRIRYWS